MTTQHSSKTRNLLARVRRIHDELDYAQRRSFEIQTGVPLVRAEQRRTRAGGIH